MSGSCIIPLITALESILKDLHGLPTQKLVEVARYVHRLSEAAQKEREQVLRQTHGCLSDEDGRAFEEALQNARRIDYCGN